jgi:hypothetical protein
MFEAFILVCSLLPNAQPPCVELQDMRGPHNTIEQCNARIEEMLPELPKMFSPPYTVAKRCDNKIGI